jgi:hypothetical protein
VPLEPGDPIRIVRTKWDSRLHATFTGVYLGRDEHGGWIGARAGTTCWRRAYAFEAASDWVTVVPAEPWQAGFYDPPQDLVTYVDITTDAVWSDHQVRTVDLDLDVIRLVDGRVFVDDEDEFALHRVAYTYPESLVARARRTCEETLAAVESGRPPFDGSHLPWLRALREQVPA